MNISFVGLGKLGLCSATCFASKGHHVMGVDAITEHIDALNHGGCPIDETGLSELLDNARHNMEFSTDVTDAINKSDATLIIVPTPSKEDGAFTNSYIKTVLKALAPALKEKDGFHIIDVVSTVMPRSCEEIFKPMLEELTGKRCGVDFGLVYNPEFIALGSVIRDFLNPDMVLIGASDDRSAKTIKRLYASLVDSDPQYHLMSLTNAEITKLSLNCFVTMKISFANELTTFCEGIEGADIDTVTNAIGADSRVGKKYLKGGLGFGGPCFPRDNRALQRAAANSNTPMQLSPSVLEVNNGVVDAISATIEENTESDAQVTLFGLPYKNNTHIIEESQSIMLAEALLEKGYSVHLYDPKALPSVTGSLRDRAILHEDPYEAAAGANALVFLTDWPEFAEFDMTKLEDAAADNAFFFDSWRTFKDQTFKTMRYYGRGMGNA